MSTAISKKDLALMLLDYYGERAAVQYPQEAENGRLERSLDIIRAGKCHYVDAHTWHVVGSDPKHVYTVRVDNDRNVYCNCPDGLLYDGQCKHRLAVTIQDALELAVGSACYAHYHPWGDEGGQGYVWPNKCHSYTFYSPVRGKGVGIADIGKADITIGGII